MKEPLLIIEVADMDSVPVIRYKGQEISNKVSVSYDWKTRTSVVGEHDLTINFFDENDPDIQTIRENMG